MAITHKINSLAAQLRLTAVMAGQYQVIHDGLKWELFPDDEGKGPHSETSYQSSEAQPLFEVFAGMYRLVVTYGEDTLEVTNIDLRAGTLRDEVIIIGQPLEGGDSEVSYHIDDADAFNLETEYERRQIEREGQNKYGQAATGLSVPPAQNESGLGQAVHQSLQDHPLLAAKAQFDGIEAKMNPLPADNQEAVEAQVSPENQPTPGPAPSNTPTPSLTR